MPGTGVVLIQHYSGILGLESMPEPKPAYTKEEVVAIYLEFARLLEKPDPKAAEIWKRVASRV